MDCINYKWPLEQADTLAELDDLVCRMLQQFHVATFELIYPDVTWLELGEILAEELDEDGINSLVYWLEIAEKQKQRLKTCLDPDSSGG